MAGAEVDAVFTANLTHIAPWDATLGLIAGADARLGQGGLLPIYGPFNQGGIQKFATMELADQSFTDLARGKIEAGEVLVCRKAGGLHVIRSRLHLPLGNFGLEKLRQDRRRAGGTLSA